MHLRGQKLARNLEYTSSKYRGVEDHVRRMTTASVYDAKPPFQRAVPYIHGLAFEAE